MKEMIFFKINNRNYKAVKGTSILKACGENGIYVPTLCYAPIFPPSSSCRICLIEIKGQKGLKTACSIDIENGMEILTETEAVKRARKANLKLLYASHIGKCPTCIRVKDCELLKLVTKYQAVENYDGKKPKIPIDDSGVIVFDLNKCIKCRRCIWACKTYGSDVLTIRGKGFDTKIETKNKKNIKNSGCISCKQCAEICPVGAIYKK